ncbi:hypothetical protein C5167_016438 [Papaver somniferum]|nr:hypothetical protein C5167_016438 [Papaver somniferum]
MRKIQKLEDGESIKTELKFVELFLLYFEGERCSLMSTAQSQKQVGPDPKDNVELPSAIQRIEMHPFKGLDFTNLSRNGEK